MCLHDLFNVCALFKWMLAKQVEILLCNYAPKILLHYTKLELPWRP